MRVRDLVGLFIFSRMILLVSLPLDGLRGYGDFTHFFNMAGMGLPMVDFWVEFPPVFPYLSLLIYKLVGGREHAYDYLLVMLLSFAQAGTLVVFIGLAKKIYGEAVWIGGRTWVYFGIILALPYGWWYFDPLAVYAMLLALAWMIDHKTAPAGFGLAIGALTKLFPLMVLPVACKWLSRRNALLVTGIAISTVVVVYISFILASPEMALASLRSQGAKGSWETVWALLDGNFSTGNFGPEIERYDAANALIPQGNPPSIPPWLTIIPFALTGGWLFWRVRIPSPKAVIAFLGVTWCLFLLWSPGYSPQWQLYLLPLILLVLPLREAVLFAVTLTFVNVLEWPVMLTRGYNWGLWITIIVRTFLLVLLAFAFWRAGTESQKSEEIN